MTGMFFGHDAKEFSQLAVQSAALEVAQDLGVVDRRAESNLRFAYDGRLAIFQKHTGRTIPPMNGSKESFIICGRRGGKSFMTALIAVFIAAFGDFKDYVTLGESLAVVCLARDRDQAKIVYRYIRSILHAIPIYAI